MTVELFAGISVADYRAASAWYETLFGGPPSFRPNDIEAVWEVAGRGRRCRRTTPGVSRRHAWRYSRVS